MGKRKFAALFFVAGLALFSWIVYQRRVRLTAWLWHVRHHNTMMFAEYLIPVPVDWYVDDSLPKYQLLFKLNPSKQASERALHPPTTISFLDEPPLRDINYWKSIQTSELKKQGSEIKMREIKLDGETIYCLGGNPMPALTREQMSALISWDCRTPGRLEILVTAPEADLTEVWDMLSHIRPVAHP